MSPQSGSNAIYLALHAVLQAGDEVLITSPGWPGHHGATAAAGGVSRRVPVTAEAGFLATPAALDAVWTPRRRVLILASPANPTGAVYAAEQLVALADWAQERDVWLIIDDIYDAFVYDGEHISMLVAASHIRSRSIVVNGVSKAYAMTGWRVGWLAGPPEVVATASRLVSRSMTHVPLITQAAALEAITGNQSELHDSARIYRERRDRLAAALNAVRGVHCPLPDGGMYVFPSVEQLLVDNPRGLKTSADIAAWLLDEAEVAVVPGEVFDAPGRLRMCFAVGDDLLNRATQRVVSALLTLTP